MNRRTVGFPPIVPRDDWVAGEFRPLTVEELGERADCMLAEEREEHEAIVEGLEWQIDELRSELDYANNLIIDLETQLEGRT